MTKTGWKFHVAASAGGLALAVLMAAGGAQSAANRLAQHADRAHTTTAEQMFADAPYGVDPVVTGPVSASFRKRQADAGCTGAAWPEIPAACYPQ